jgi:hypothetical protein
MPTKIGAASQVINFNFVNEFVAENMNKLLYSTFTPGVLYSSYRVLTAPPPTQQLLNIEMFSGLIRPVNQDFLIKVDLMNSTSVEMYPDKPYLTALITWSEPDGGYDYDSDYLVSFQPLSESEITDYHIILGLAEFIDEVFVAFDTSVKTEVFLNNNCINYDLLQRSGVRTLDGSNSDYIIYTDDDGVRHIKYIGNESDKIPLTNAILCENLNAEYINGLSLGNESNRVALKNDILSKNVITSRIISDSGYEYAIGESGDGWYSGYSGYVYALEDPEDFTGGPEEIIEALPPGVELTPELLEELDTLYPKWYGSGWSGMSGYIPINNEVLQTSLNAEYFGGYKLEDYSLVNHTHTLDEIFDGEIYKKVSNVNYNGLITSSGIGDGALEYRHQVASGTTSFRFDYDGATHTAKKIFALAGQIENGGYSGVTFRKEFSGKPRVFLLNNETDEWKSVDDAGVSGWGFWVNHLEGTSGANLASDTTAPFSTHWIAFGELV